MLDITKSIFAKAVRPVRDLALPIAGTLGLIALATLFSGPLRETAMMGLMLFFPLLDKRWVIPKRRGERSLKIWLAVSIGIAALLLWNPSHFGTTASMLARVAVPEEWFFRAYVMSRAGSGWGANVFATLLFASVHASTRGPLTAVLVVGPSLIYGRMFQRTRDLPLVALIHLLSDMVYFMVLVKYFRV